MQRIPDARTKQRPIAMIELRRPLLLMALLAVLLVAATACSEPSNTGIPTGAGSASATSRPSGTGDGVAFARCMRQHGVNMPDPNPDIQWGQLNETPEWDAAWQACRNLLPPAPDGAEQLPSAPELEQYRAFAVCMRAHEVDLSDPDPTGNMTIGGRLAHLPRDQVNNDSGYRAAYETCKDKLPGRETGTKGVQ
jgi:hypothetical protein